MHLKPRRGNVSRGGASDLFCTCLLRTKETEPKLILQENEIADAKWIDKEELLRSGIYGLKGSAWRKSVEAALAASGRRAETSGLRFEEAPLGFTKGKVATLRSKL
mmetsp:Transcript_34826/g.64477  ORF Transcript_34826/g.64477 Transcript_34826/m.64477 type:complete len:106 (-) Transcript_34826:52-369(-)